MHWTQNYDPLGPFSPLVAGLPIVLLLGLLATGRVRAHWAALVGLVTAILAAVFVFQPIEVSSADSGGLLSCAGAGLIGRVKRAALGLFSIGRILLDALFSFKHPAYDGP